MWHWMFAMMVVMVTVVVAEEVAQEHPDSRMESTFFPTQDTTTVGTVEPTKWSTDWPMEKPDSSAARPVDCADLLMAGVTTSGEYKIYPFTCTCEMPVKVWCDMETDGGGWTVFLNRQTDNGVDKPFVIDFNVTWDDYKKGFGRASGEYYLGNEVLHKMTHGRSYAVRLDMEFTSGGSDSGSYQYFKVNDEANRYTAYVSGRTSGTYSVSSCFRYMNGRGFTTHDRDHDLYTGNCASTKGGAWWLYNCKYFNPTIPYKGNSLSITCPSMSRKFVKSLQIKLRPSICDSSVKTIHLNNVDCDCDDDVNAPVH